MQEYDRSSKWLIEHFGAALLRLAGIENVTTCRALPGEVVQPRQLPDGLLEARLKGRPESVFFVIEIATYPDRRVDEQVLRDALLVLLDRKSLPEIVTIVLRPKGTYRVSGAEAITSSLGLSHLQLRWHVVEMWSLSAASLLAAQEIGLVPWVALAEIDGPPEATLRQCRLLLDERAPADLLGNLLAVTQVLLGLRYNDPQLRAIFGGKQAMIESPVLQELIAETRQQSILHILKGRFGAVPDPLAAALRREQLEEKLNDLTLFAATCSDLAAFEHRLRIGN